ncbi:MAG: hypothetical protein ACUVTX_09335 [Bacteroidales bacterium]
MKNFITFLIFIITCQYKVFSQKAIADSLNSAGNPTSVEKSSIHSLYAGVGYGSNMIYLGSTISQDKPYKFAALTYGLGDKLYLSATAVHLSGVSSFVAFYAGTVSFSYTFNSWFDISGGISHYQVPVSLTDTLFQSFTYGDITLGIDWRLLYTKFSAGRIFASESSNYYQIRNSRYFQTPEFSKHNFYFSFEPYINLIFGTLTKTETFNETIIIAAPPFRKRGAIQQQQGTVYTSFFSLLEADIGVPVAFNSSRFTIEAEPGYTFPFYEESAFPGTKGFLLMFSLYLRIF